MNRFNYEYENPAYEPDVVEEEAAGGGEEELNEELNETFMAADIQAITWVTHKRIHNVLRGYYKV